MRIRRKGSHRFWEVKVKKYIQNLNLLCMGLKMELTESWRLLQSALMLTPCISAIKILGFKTPIPLDLDSCLNFWEISSDNSVITLLTFLISFSWVTGERKRKVNGWGEDQGPSSGLDSYRKWLSMPMPVSKGLEMALTYSAWQQLSSNPSISRNLSYGNNQECAPRDNFQHVLLNVVYYREKKRNAQREGKSYVGMGHTPI